MNCPQREKRKKYGRGGIRTHAPEETGALNQRLRPLGHSTGCYGRLGDNIGPKSLVGMLSDRVTLHFSVQVSKDCIGMMEPRACETEAEG